MSNIDILIVDRLVRFAQVLTDGSRSYARFRLRGKGSRILPVTGANREVLIHYVGI